MSKRKLQNVQVDVREVTIPTYEPGVPDRHPMFLENRVYQGSSGRVYPLPFTDRIAEHRTDRKWKAIFIENEYVEVMILPEIGGRIHAIFDKTNGYDIIYRQSVIKPALVGLAGSWISGGIEFNWPQHHRPATFMPVDFEIEKGDDGTITVWLSDHEPMARMKGMHGICLYPDRSVVEVKVRLFNRTPFTQTFLWWANAATRVHEAYQSFFPPDVHYVADHAKRAITTFPLCTGKYYGVDYSKRAAKGVPEVERPSKFRPPEQGGDLPSYPPNDLTWYSNIPVPTSYMCIGSTGDFFGGYDHKDGAGVVHVADHHIAPGKKQWTWGNNDFGYAWDRNLSEDGAPYIELMAGVFTDNQPDFSFLEPYETRAWSQYWYGIQQIGVPLKANIQAAVSLSMDGRDLVIGVAATSVLKDACVRLQMGKKRAEWTAQIAPDKPFIKRLARWAPFGQPMYSLTVFDSDGREIIAYAETRVRPAEEHVPASEPLPPEEIDSIDRLYLSGKHVEQYRHPTRDPAGFWAEALRRDPSDSRCSNAMGLVSLRRGEFGLAENYFRTAIARLTERNPNPANGEVFYNLGLTLRFQMDGAKPRNDLFEEAYSAFYKAAWNDATAGPAFLALAELDSRRARWDTALGHVDRSLTRNSDNSNAGHLRSLILGRLGREGDANEVLARLLRSDPLDQAARLLSGRSAGVDGQTRLDIAHDLARSGFLTEAIHVLESHAANEKDPRELGVAPLIFYTLGWLWQRNGDEGKARNSIRKAEKVSHEYCFPNRLEEFAVLEHAIQLSPDDAKPHLHLGNLLYDRRRYEEAIENWETCVKLSPDCSLAWRNLGIAYFNFARDLKRARSAYEKAFAADSSDARLLYERDQLWKRIGAAPTRRLWELKKNRPLVDRRDDLTVELCRLLNLAGRHEEARSLLSGRRFQPWEGGEGLVLEQHVQTNLSLGKCALKSGNSLVALSSFNAALAAPENLGEAKHLLVNQADIYFFLGLAADLHGDRRAARYSWERSAGFTGDFQKMSISLFSEMTFYSALSLQKLGDKKTAKALLRSLLAFAEKLESSKAVIEYFATSLPAMLLFETDLQAEQARSSWFLQAQALTGLGKRKEAEQLLSKLIEMDPNNASAIDLRSTFLQNSYA